MISEELPVQNRMQVHMYRKFQTVVDAFFPYKRRRKGSSESSSVH